MSVRIIIKIFLTLQLLLLIFRQMIDFAGIQWLMILVNALAIIITITAFFGYLLLYASFQVLLIIYNIYVICVYSRMITLDNITIMPTSMITKEHFNDDGYPSEVHQSPVLPSAQLLSFDTNSRSFWYVIVSNHISNIQAHLSHYQPPSVQHQSQPFMSMNHHSHPAPLSPTGTNNDANSIGHIRHPLDESLVDICVQYIEVAIASIHILFSLLAIGLILLKQKLERDKFLRNHDKTTPPLPPYTLNPQMNHYMSFTPSISTSKNSLYTQNSSVRRSNKRRRSTRSLHSQKSKSNSMGALNIRASSGSLRSISKQGHRKSATSLLMNNNDTSFSNNTIGSRSGAKSSHSNYQLSTNNNNNSLYGTIKSITKPAVPLRQSRNVQTNQQSRHSVYTTNGYSSAAQHAAKFLNSDSETDYYHTFTPAYLNNGLANPLYGKRNSYLDSSETAI